jgi:5-dehydro-2-deoxygluconokinase
MYRTPTCPDWRLRLDDFDVDAVLDAPFLLAGGTGFAREPSAGVHREVLRRHRHQLLFDLDYRPSFWTDADEYRGAVAEVLPFADMVIGNEEEVGAATGVGDAAQAVKRLQSIASPRVILKRGGKGTMLFEGDRITEIPPVLVNVVNGLGAGDAFLAALTQALIAGHSLEASVRRANWAGSWVASKVACSAAMPSLRELELGVAEAVVT